MSDTRNQILDAAEQQFADRGFYGVSLANIAETLGVTKQALLHHFGTKERLYGSVLDRISKEFLNALHAQHLQTLEPEEQFRSFLRDLLGRSSSDASRDRLLVRELLDNRERAAEADAWYMRDFLEALTRVLKTCCGWQQATDAEAFCAVYQLVGAASYYAISEPTLTGLGGEKGYRAITRSFAPQFELLIEAVLKQQAP
ncbi:MAG: TetR/AcrR family transcriptional regulator [Pseudomonadota bacterium]